MAYTINNITKLYADTESTFGTHDGDFSGTGVQLKPKEVIDRSEITKDLVREYRTLTDRSDVVIPVEGATMAKISVSHVLPGISRTTGDVDSDGLSTVLELVMGTKDESVSDVCDTGTTATNLVLTNSGSYAVGDLVIVAGEPRIVTAVNGTADITVSPALSSAPAATTVISNVEWYQRPSNSTLSSGAWYLEGEDSELKWLMKGMIATGFTLDAFKSNESMFFSIDLEGADWLGGASVPSITVPVVTAPNTPVTASAGDGIALNDSVGALWQPCPGEITVSGFLANTFVSGPGAINGKCGVIAIMPEERKIVVTLYQDGTMSKLEALIGNTTPVIISIGDTLESILGVACAEARVSKYPGATDIDTVNAIQVEFDIDMAKLFRG